MPLRQEQYHKADRRLYRLVEWVRSSSIGHTSALTVVDAQAIAPHRSSAEEIYFIAKVLPDALGALASTVPRREETRGRDANCANGNFAFPRRVHDPEHRTCDTSVLSTEQAGYSPSM